MRLVDPIARSEILNVACTFVQTQYAFSTYAGCETHFQVISGELEGIMGWMTVNYLKHGLVSTNRMTDNPTSFGFMDMGGASAQISFEPTKSMAVKHADDLRAVKLRLLDGSIVEYKLFVSSFLGFGANEAYRRYKTALAANNNGIDSVSDPCMPQGLSLNELDVSVPPKPLNFSGTGHFTECYASVTPLLNKEIACSETPCLFNGVHAPLSDIRNHHFLGVSGV